MEHIVVIKNIVWTILPFFFAWIIFQLKNNKILMNRIAFIVRKADEIVEWLEEEYPDLPYIDKIDKVIDMLMKALEDAGYDVGTSEELERAAKAAFNRYKRQKDITSQLANLINKSN